MSTISISDVSAMLCELGIGFAQHFDLDTDEVVQFLDTTCEDKLGVNPEASKLFEKVQNDEDDDDEEDASATEEMHFVTQSEIDEWFATPKKGGLSLKDLRAKAKEYGLTTDKASKADLKSAFEELVIPDPEEDADETQEDEPIQPTKEQIEEWCQPPNKGGVSIKALREKASEMGVDVSELKKRSEIKEAMIGGLEGEQVSADNLTVRRNNVIGCWILHVDGKPTNLVVQSSHAKRKLVGYITKNGELSKKITKPIREKAAKLGVN